MRIVEFNHEPFHELVYLSSSRDGEPRQVKLPFHRAKVDALPKGVESIVAVADLQGREKGGENRLVGEAVAEELALLAELGEITKPDLIILAGDFYDYPDFRKLGGTGDVTGVWNRFAGIAQHLVGVYGNHDLLVEDEIEAHAHILDGNQLDLAGIQFGGVSGIIGRTSRNQRKSPDEFLKALKKSLGKQAKILVLHQGPNDIVNGQLGEPSIRRFLENNGEALVVFGHCRWEIPLVEMGKNQLLNVDNRLVVLTS